VSEAAIGIDLRDERDGWLAEVTVTEAGASTRHRVRVSRAARERLAPRATPTELVRASFAFLLDREAKESILPAFAIEEIERYFPQYATEIAARLA